MLFVCELNLLYEGIDQVYFSNAVRFVGEAPKLFDVKFLVCLIYFLNTNSKRDFFIYYEFWEMNWIRKIMYFGDKQFSCNFSKSDGRIQTIYLLDFSISSLNQFFF